MPKFTLRQLEYFKAVALHGSISAAAEAERVSRSAISAALDDLEGVLGSSLCVRTKTHGIVLTDNGRQALQRAESILGEAEELQHLGSGGELRGTLTLGCFPSLAPTLIPLLWQEFTRAHPQVTLHVITTGRAELVTKLERGEVDLAFAYNLHDYESLGTASLYDTYMHAIMHPDHALAAATTVRADNLASEPLLLMDLSPSTDDILGYFASLSLTPHIALRSPQFEFIRSLVARGAGYSLFIQRPRMATSYEGLPIKTLRVVPEPPVVRANVAWAVSRRLPRRAEAFVELALRRAAQLAPEPV